MPTGSNEHEHVLKDVCEAVHKAVDARLARVEKWQFAIFGVGTATFAAIIAKTFIGG